MYKTCFHHPTMVTVKTKTNLCLIKYPNLQDLSRSKSWRSMSCPQNLDESFLSFLNLGFMNEDLRACWNQILDIYYQTCLPLRILRNHYDLDALNTRYGLDLKLLRIWVFWSEKKILRKLSILTGLLLRFGLPTAYSCLSVITEVFRNFITIIWTLISRFPSVWQAVHVVYLLKLSRWSTGIEKADFS